MLIKIVPILSRRDNIAKINHRIRGIDWFGDQCSVTVLFLKDTSVGWRGEVYKLSLTSTPERCEIILTYQNKNNYKINNFNNFMIGNILFVNN